MLLRNFISVFHRYKTASLLNLLGLSIAFAATYIILTQVDYEYNYNKGVEGHDHIFRTEVHFLNSDFMEWGMTTVLPVVQAADSISPHVTASSAWSPMSSIDMVEVGEHTFSNINLYEGFGDFLRAFSPQMICGTTASLKDQKVVLTRSLAERFFGTTDAVGKTLKYSTGEKAQMLEVGGVCEEFPRNSFLKQECIYKNMKIEKWMEEYAWGAWNYPLYIKLDDPAYASAVGKQLAQFHLRNNTQKDTVDIRLTPIADTYFSGVDPKFDQGNRQVVHLLLFAAFLLLFIAAVNFMNFSLAEVPMRLRGINTRKVLGESLVQIRLSLILENVLVNLVAFALMFFWIHLFISLGFSDLVQADLHLSEHIGLLAGVAGISIMIGVLAGLYPAWYITSFQPALVLKGSYGLSPRGRKLSILLVSLQYFISFVLIIVVGVMYLQSHLVHNTDYGFDKDLIIIGNSSSEVHKQHEAAREELLRISGVEDVSFSQFALGASENYQNWGQRREGESDETIYWYNHLPVDRHFFHTMGIKITEGRLPQDSKQERYVFNESARKAMSWMKVDEPAFGYKSRYIGAFCKDIKYKSLREDPSKQVIGFWVTEECGSTINVRVGKQVDKLAVLKELQKQLEKFTPGYDFGFRFLDEALNDNYRKEMRFGKQILLFSLLAIFITLVGVFGLTMFESESRRKETGIRKVFGSTTREILLRFNLRYLYILIGSFVVAAPVSWWLGRRWLEDFAERTPIAWWLYAVGLLLVAAITIGTVTWQSWKNASDNPIHSIKTE